MWWPGSATSCRRRWQVSLQRRYWRSGIGKWPSRARRGIEVVRRQERHVSQPTSHTLQSDAPLSAAKDIEAAAVDDSLDGQELVGRTITVDCPRQEVYEFWRDFQN